MARGTPPFRWPPRRLSPKSANCSKRRGRKTEGVRWIFEEADRHWDRGARGADREFDQYQEKPYPGRSNPDISASARRAHQPDDVRSRLDLGRRYGKQTGPAAG